MGTLYHFERLIKKYAIDFPVVTLKDGHYEAGDWIEGEIKHRDKRSGAMIPLPEEKIFGSGGTYKKEDRRLLVLEEIPFHAYVFINNKKYQVLEDIDFSYYAGFYSYILKRVDSFDRTEEFK